MQGLGAAIFDNDGTVSDTHDMILNSFRYSTEKVLGKALPDEVLMAKVGIPLVDQMRDFTDDPEVVQQLMDAYHEDNLADHEKKVKRFPGTIEALERLREGGYRLAIATSKRHALAERGLGAIGVLDYFEVVVGCEDTERHKPDPDPVLEAARRLGVGISECAYIGDAAFDIRAAKAAGCTSIGVTWGMFGREVLEAEDPDYIVESYPELADLLISIEAR